MDKGLSNTAFHLNSFQVSKPYEQNELTHSTEF